MDIPPGANIDEVYALLEAGKRSGAWDLEEGHCGHPVPSSPDPAVALKQSRRSSLTARP